MILCWYQYSAYVWN